MLLGGEGFVKAGGGRVDEGAGMERRVREMASGCCGRRIVLVCKDVILLVWMFVR